MPLVHIEWFPGRSIEQKREVIDVVTRELCRIAKCRPETVTVIFRDVEREDWGRAGTLFADNYEYEFEGEPDGAGP